MRTESAGWRPVVSWLASMVLAALLTLNCSVPNLESQNCTDARTRVREFYSLHIAGDMNFTQESLEKRKDFLTPEFYNLLKTRAPHSVDRFTLTENDFPKAFRVGECTQTESGVRFEVLLFWKTDTRSEQRSIHVDAEYIGDKWLIASVGT